MKNKRLNLAGFSLIELLVVIAVIAILTAIAIPLYNSYTLRAHRSDAISALSTIAMNEEAHMLSSGIYTGTLNEVWLGTTSTRGFYAIDLSGVNSSGYVITATPIGSQTSDSGDCPHLTLAANDGSIIRTPAGCWE